MMKAMEKIKLLKALKAATAECNTATSPLKKLKAVKEVQRLRQKLRLLPLSAASTRPNKADDTAIQTASALPQLVLPENATRKEIGKVVEDWLKANVQGKIITASDGKKIRFNRIQSVKHLTSEGRKDKLSALVASHVVDVFQTGEAKGREELNKPRKDFVAFHRYDKWLTIDGLRIHAVAKAGEKIDGSLEAMPELVAYSAAIYSKTAMDSAFQSLERIATQAGNFNQSNSGLSNPTATFDSAQDEPLATLTILEITDLQGNPISLDELDEPTAEEKATKAQRATYYAFDEDRTKAQRQRDNNAVFALLDRLEKGELNEADLTETDRQALAKYSGNGGGLKGRDGKIGSAHEYYTPAPVAQAMWDSLQEMGFGGGRVLDPCSGTGIFGALSPQNATVDAVELDATSAAVNRYVNAGADYSVQNQPFEAVAAATPDESYDAVVTNVPFGSNASRIAKNQDSRYRQETLEGYFVLRSLDKLKPRGLAAFLVPSSFMDGKSGKPAKVRLAAALKAEFMGAYRLPSKVFSSADTGADVVTDIVFFRKYSRPMLDKIEELQAQNPALLTEANVLWRPYLSGKYFKDEGKKYIIGTVAKRQNRFGKMADTVLSDDSVSNIAKAIRGFGQSRIAWDVLEEAETMPIMYQDGDAVFRNGETLIWQQGKFHVQTASNDGADATADAVVSQLDTPFAAFEADLTFEAVRTAVAHYQRIDRGHEVPSWVAGVLTAAGAGVKRAQIFQTALTALAVKEVAERHAADQGFNFLEHYDALSAAMKRQARQSVGRSVEKGIRDAVKLMKLHYGKGGYSALWRGERGSVEKEYDTAQKIEAARYKHGGLTLPLAEMQAINPEFDVFQDDDWTISADGQTLMQTDDLLVGNYGEVLAKLNADMAAAANPEIAAKIARIKALAAERVKRIDADKLRFSLRTPYVTPEEMAQFLKTLLPMPQKVMVKNDGGKRYADIENTGKDLSDAAKLQNRLGDYLKNGTLTLGSTEFQRYRSKEEAMKALRDVINETNTLFNAWVHANPVIMARIKSAAENPDNLFFEQPADETPLAIAGLSPEWTLHGYQAAFVRRQNRFFGGINGFDVGLGKTFTALSAVQYAQNVGTRKKTLFVVPGSVLSNWHKEAVGGNGRAGVYDEATAERCLFVGAETSQGRLKVKSANYTRDLNAILEHRHDKVFMSFEAFEKIRLKAETAEEYVKFLRQVDASFAEIERKAKDEKNEARANEVVAVLTEDKLEAAPFLEDMGFDSLVIDEAHAFKNAKRTFEFGSRTKGLGSLNSASRRGVDAAAKAWYLRGKRGDGVLLLTATPITNSPLEIYSMMSLAAGEERVNRHMLGVQGADAFMEVSCVLDNRDDYTVTGDFKPTDMFVGLKNTEILRNMIDSIAVVKNAADVGLTIRLPEAVEQKVAVTLSEEGKTKLAAYRLAYSTARKLLDDQPVTPEEMSNLNEVSHRLGEPWEKIAQPFSLIRKMDMLIMDEELDARASFYNIEGSEEQVQTAIAAFNKLGIKERRDRKPLHTAPENIVGERIRKSDDKTTEIEYTVKVAAWINDEGRIVLDTLDFGIQQRFEALLEKHGAEVSVNTPPKLAALAANVRNEQVHIRVNGSDGLPLPNAKQLVFCDELALHNKIKRVLHTQAGIPADKITFVSGRFNEKPEEVLAVQNGFNNDGEDNRYCVVIANKKAEVGINLQKGTQAVHHLTIPWTPDAITQRNGRGVRQGNASEQVNVYYYDADGTFDTYRRSVVERKGQWINTLMNPAHDGVVETAGLLTNEEYDRLLRMDGSAADMAAMQEEIEQQAKQARADSARRAQITNIEIYRRQQEVLRGDSDYAVWVKKLSHRLAELAEDTNAAMRRVDNSINKGSSEKVIKANKKKYEQAHAEMLELAQKLDMALAKPIEYSGQSYTLTEFVSSRYANTGHIIRSAEFADKPSALRTEWENHIATAKNMSEAAERAMLQDAQISGAYSADLVGRMKDGYLLDGQGRVLTPGMVGFDEEFGYTVAKSWNGMTVFSFNLNGTNQLNRGQANIEHLGDAVFFHESESGNGIEAVWKAFAKRDEIVIDKCNNDVEQAERSYHLASKRWPAVSAYLQEVQPLYHIDKNTALNPPLFPLCLVGRSIGNSNARLKELAAGQEQAGILPAAFNGDTYALVNPDAFSDQPVSVEVFSDGLKAFGVRLNADDFLELPAHLNLDAVLQAVYPNYMTDCTNVANVEELNAVWRKLMDAAGNVLTVPDEVSGGHDLNQSTAWLIKYGAFKTARALGSNVDVFLAATRQDKVNQAGDAAWFYINGNTYKLHKQLNLRSVILNQTDAFQLAFIPKAGKPVRFGDEERIAQSGATRENVWIVTKGGMKLLQEDFASLLNICNISFEPI